MTIWNHEFGGVLRSEDLASVRVVTQAECDALTPGPETLYLIVEE